MPPDHSSWDIPASPFGEADPLNYYGGCSGPAARCCARTELFEDATRHTVSLEPPPSDLGAEYRARVDAVRSHVAAPVPGSGLLVRLLYLNPYAARNGLEYVAGIMVLIVIVEVGVKRTAWAGILLLLVVGIIAAVKVYRRDQLKPALLALEARECPDCGYDLAGAPPGVPLDRTDGVNVGPRACPECGVPWPLVPPPGPEE